MLRAASCGSKKKLCARGLGAAGYYNGFTYLCAKAVAELPSDALPETQLRTKQPES